MIDWTEIPDGDQWELFTRDFLSELGFVIEVGPGRGPDAGRDLLVSEQLKGRFQSKKFTWLVSCKHFASSAKSVGIEQEVNITDRLKQHSAHGFLGVYSTLPSSSLVARLQQYLQHGDIEAFEIFDGKKIEGHFVTAGLSKLALRYFPASYRRLRPIQEILGDRVEIRCRVCDSDILARSVLGPAKANIVWEQNFDHQPRYRNVYVACKGECDRRLEGQLRAAGHGTSWEEINDLFNPLIFLKNILGYMNMLRRDPGQFSEEAHERMKEIYIALAQRTLRELTEEDIDRFKRLRILDDLPI